MKLIRYLLLHSVLSITLAYCIRPNEIEQSTEAIKILWDSVGQGNFYQTIPGHHVVSAAWQSFLKGEGLKMIEEYFK